MARRNIIDRIFAKIFREFGLVLCRRRRSSISKYLYDRFNDFRYRMENVDFDFSTNGEERVIDCIASLKPRCLFDVGANRGEWSLDAYRRTTDCSIHAFEIVPEVFEKLQKAIGKDHTRIQLNAFGLSEQSGSQEIFYSPDKDYNATAFPIGEHLENANSVGFRVMRADEYMKAQGINDIDFLKIDVEGMEHMVLRGFGDRLRNVRCIQFEYGVFNITSHFLLYDFFNLLKPSGFVIGKIYPDHVEFFDFHFMRENFMGNNYLAVRKDDKELLDLLENNRS